MSGKEYLIEQLCQRIGCDAQTSEKMLGQSNWDLYEAERLYESGAHRRAHDDGFASSTVPPTNSNIQSMDAVLGRNRERRGGTGAKDTLIYSGGNSSGLLVESGTNVEAQSEAMASELFAAARQLNERTARIGSLNRDVGGGSAAQIQGRRVGSLLPGSAVGDVSDGGSAMKGGKAVAMVKATSTRVQAVLTVYKNGFVLNGGSLIKFNDPAARGISEAIRNGRTPPGVVVPAGHVLEMKIVNKKIEEYAPPASTVSIDFFSEESGRSLASSSPSRATATAIATTTSTTASSSSAQPICDDDNDNDDRGDGNDDDDHDEQEPVVVDESLPTTTVQVRLIAGGKPLRLVLNRTHTLAHLVRAIRAADGNSPASFMLMTPMPRRTLTDASKTLEELDLVNSVVVQRP
jgi:SEP domain/UBX domain